MWLAKQFRFQARDLDFTSAGLGNHHATTSVFADEVEIVNALDFVDFNEAPFQTTVCECCGTPGCNSGSWVNIRRLDDALIVIPAFDEMCEGSLKREEYAPPEYINTKGAPLLRNLALETLQERVPLLGDLAWCAIQNSRANDSSSR